MEGKIDKAYINYKEIDYCSYFYFDLETTTKKQNEIAMTKTGSSARNSRVKRSKTIGSTNTTTLVFKTIEPIISRYVINRVDKLLVV